MGACGSSVLNTERADPAPALSLDAAESSKTGAEQDPLDQMMHRVKEHFHMALNFPPHRKIGLDASFFGMGGDSLSATQLVVGLRDSLGSSHLTLQRVVDQPTVRGLSALLLQASTETSTEVISVTAVAEEEPPVPPAEQLQQRLPCLGQGGGPSRMQVICLHPGLAGHPPLVLLNPAGASALAYVQLAQRLAAHEPCTAIFAVDDGCILNHAGCDLQYPFSSVTDVVLECEPIVTEIARLYCTADTPVPRVSLAGWSWGGTVAVALASFA